MQLLSRIFRYSARQAYGIYAWLTFASFTLPALALVAVLPGEARRRHVIHLAARLILWTTASTPRLQGLENLPESACIVVANHASYLDGMILAAVLPPRFGFVIKREMTRVPLAHLLLRRIGSLFVDRSNTQGSARDARKILQVAARQRSLVFFPEGTFRREPGLQRFRNGAFVAAVHAGVPVVPAAIQGSRAMLPAGRKLPQPGVLEVTIKKPIEASGSDRPVSELVALCRAGILEDLTEPDLMD